MNKVNLLGRLTADPELKTTPTGVSVCTFTLAVNRRFKNNEGDYDADFINCVAWRNTAEFICKHFNKGKMIAIAGAIQTRTYEKDGQKRYITEVLADEAYFAGDGKKTEGNTDFSPMPDYNEQDLPF